MNKKLLEVTLVLVSDNSFDVEIFEPETGEFRRIKCHDNGDITEVENREITDEIRSWVGMIREKNN